MNQIRQIIDVNVPSHAAYRQWMQFEQFPRFMDGVREVKQIDNAHLHWRAHRHGRELEWDSEITQQVPDQLIAWRDLGGPGNHGSIQFASLRENLTRIELIMEAQVSGVPEGQTAHFQDIQQRIEQDLMRFKQMLEKTHLESNEECKERQASDAPSSEAASNQQASGTQENASEKPERPAESSSSQAWLPGLLQAWEEPMVMMRKMSDEMDQLFERFLGRPMAFRFGQGGVPGKWMPTVEVTQRDGELIICAELPGLKKEAIRIEIRQGKLLMEGERPKPDTQVVPQGFRRSERNYGPFYRMIPLPESIDANHCVARLHEGVLEITLKLHPSGAQLGRPISIDT